MSKLGALTVVSYLTSVTIAETVPCCTLPLGSGGRDQSPRARPHSLSRRLSQRPRKAT
jgi:hypothetical protein